jgi:hypothetical protein
MTDRSFRSLTNLKKSASTARVLNLLKVWEDHGHTEEWAGAPLFQHRALNRALILKHRLRRDEIDIFRVRRHVATKIILPIDERDLRAGGRFLFVDQIGFDRALEQTMGIDLGHPDRRTLGLIAELPGFDPFLLREQLRRHELSPASCYFAVSPADMTSMNMFVQEEILPLVRLSLGAEAMKVEGNPVARFAGKILSSTAEGDLVMLGRTLQLRPDEYEEGIFSWKGFLYYKWALQSVVGSVGTVAEAVRKVRPHGGATPEQKVDIERCRRALRARMVETCDDAASMLHVYDTAFRRLTAENDPAAFRDFLLEAPTLFWRLGEQLGAIQHIVSFWRYRFGGRKTPPDAAELLDLLGDFENSLATREDTDSVSLAA